MQRPWLKNIPYDKRILEIGPLFKPNISKDKYKNAFYADIRSTEEIKYFYKDNPDVPNDRILNIDYIIKNSYSESFENIEKFDYIVATHVIEHIPQLISFFTDIATILNPKGKLCLSIPDKRFCLDHFRFPTSFSECYDLYTSDMKISKMRVLDNLISTSSNNDPVFWWQLPDSFKYFHDDNDRQTIAIEKYHEALKNDYIDMDIHFSVFTPESFLIFLFHMIDFYLLPFKCFEFDKTQFYTNEFNCVLEFCPNVTINKSNENISEKQNIIELLMVNNDLSYFLHFNNRMKYNFFKLKKLIKNIKSWKILYPLKIIKKNLFHNKMVKN